MGHNPRQQPARLAAKLLFIRTRILGLSQNEMIRRLGFVGELIQSHISAFEQENEKLRREPPLGVLLQYARVAKTTVEKLIDDSIPVEALMVGAAAKPKKRKSASTSPPKAAKKSIKRSDKGDH
jgi:transcriptional regulator with XRE-family HTH domain